MIGCALIAGFDDFGKGEDDAFLSGDEFSGLFLDLEDAFGSEIHRAVTKFGEVRNLILAPKLDELLSRF
jgi:hypothetical protein